MKKLFYVLLLVVVAGSSCKKDKINNAQDLVKRLQKGVWQFDRTTENGTTTTIERFTVFKFESDKTLRLYATRTEASDALYYRVKDANGNYQLYIYDNQDKYNTDTATPFGTLKYNNDEFTLETGSTIIVCRNYSSMDKTRDLPRGSL